MKTSRIATVAAGTIAVTMGLTACGSGGQPQADDDGGIPAVWSVYSVGSGTYNDMAAVADAITTEYGESIRLIPSDTGVGRMTPLKEGTAEVGRFGEEYIYAFEGDLDFAQPTWGPQDLRVVWGIPTAIGLGVTEDSGIDSVEDLAGKRLPNVTANPSVNNKLDAYLAYGGLTRDDVELVDVNYSDQADALSTGRVDAVIYNPYASQMFEIEATHSLEWLNLDDMNDERAERIEDVSPSVTIEEYSAGAGMDNGESVLGVHYATPVVAYADTDDESIRAFIDAVEATFPQYEDVTVTAPDLAPDRVAHSPLVVPFHDATVAYLEERAEWTDDAAATNEELIERGVQLREKWDELSAADGDEFVDEWTEWKSTLE